MFLNEYANVQYTVHRIRIMLHIRVFDRQSKRKVLHGTQHYTSQPCSRADIPRRLTVKGQNGLLTSMHVSHTTEAERWGGKVYHSGRKSTGQPRESHLNANGSGSHELP